VAEARIREEGKISGIIFEKGEHYCPKCGNGMIISSDRKHRICGKCGFIVAKQKPRKYLKNDIMIFNYIKGKNIPACFGKKYTAKSVPCNLGFKCKFHERCEIPSIKNMRKEWESVIDKVK